MTSNFLSAQTPLATTVLFEFNFGAETSVGQKWEIFLKNQNGVEYNLTRPENSSLTRYYLYVQQNYQVDVLKRNGRNIANFALFVVLTAGLGGQASFRETYVVYTGQRGVAPGDQVAPTVIQVNVNQNSPTLTFPAPAPVIGVSREDFATYQNFPN